MTTQATPQQPGKPPYDPNAPKRDERDDKDKDKDKDKDDDKDAPGRSTQTSGPGSVTGSGTNNVASVKDPRGGGRGDDANAIRRIHAAPLPTISHEEHVKELVAMAEANEQYNNQVNKAQQQDNEAGQKLISDNEMPPKDPKKEQQEVLKAYTEANDPKLKEKRLKGEIEARKKRDEAKVKRQMEGR